MHACPKGLHFNTSHLLLLGGNSRIEMMPPTQDDPKQRRPSIEKAKKVLNWAPKVYLYNRKHKQKGI